MPERKVFEPSRSTMRFIFGLAISAAQTQPVRQEIEEAALFFEALWRQAEDEKKDMAVKPQEGQG